MGTRQRHVVLMGLDALIAAIAVVVALYLRFDGAVPTAYTEQLARIVPLFIAVRVLSLAAMRLYENMWRYAGLKEMLRAGLAVAAGTVALVGIGVLTNFITLPRSVFAIEALLFVIGMGMPRLYVRWRRSLIQRGQASGRRRVLIVGAGDAGAMLVREFEQQPHLGIDVVAFVDDDETKVGRQLGGVRVAGPRAQIPDIVRRRQVEEIIIAMPSVDTTILRETMRICRDTGVRLKTLPPLRDLFSGRVRAEDVRDVRIEDLLGREPVATDLSAISGYLRGRRVLVTGAGGSIGSELCRQVATFAPEQLILLEHNENSIFEIEGELKARFASLEVVPLIADIRDAAKVDRIMEAYAPHVVFHAAAHKHVPLMEANPDEAVANNVLGTRNVADAAARCGTERFVMVSTDKAVNPGNVMGATKRLAEMVVQAKHGVAENGTSVATRFVSVRFGNVLGSRGSVIPIFRRQIERGGPVTVTHPDMTRYFMTIPEAVQLILQAAALGDGGEVFVLDMGEPVRIVDLARDLIRLSGFEPDVDIDIVFTGVRPGEKLFEELINDGETVMATSHEKITALSSIGIDANMVSSVVSRLEDLLAAGVHHDDDRAHLVRVLYGAVDGEAAADVPAYAGEVRRRA